MPSTYKNVKHTTCNVLAFLARKDIRLTKSEIFELVKETDPSITSCEEDESHFEYAMEIIKKSRTIEHLSSGEEIVVKCFYTLRSSRGYVYIHVDNMRDAPLAAFESKGMMEERRSKLRPENVNTLLFLLLGAVDEVDEVDVTVLRSKADLLGPKIVDELINLLLKLRN